MNEIKEGTLVKGTTAYSEAECFGVMMYKTGDVFVVGPYIGSPNGIACKSIEPLHLMPPLPKNVRIGDECLFCDYEDGPGINKKLIAITSDGRFVDNTNLIWDHCRPIKKELRLRRLSEIIRMVEDSEDCALPGNSTSIYYNGSLYAFKALMIRAGMNYCEEWNYPKEWLEEVE